MLTTGKLTTVTRGLRPSVLFVIAMLTMAQAQTPPEDNFGRMLAPTGPFTNKDGKVIGTATTFGNRIYVRDLKGELFMTIVIDRDGTRTIYDPHGKVIDQSPGQQQK